jgi:mRNA-degrading endonuclease toxin of MazEF toxin-antitoxin module
MIFVDFKLLQKIATDVNAKNKQVKDSSVVLSQYLNLLSNFLPMCNNLYEDELAMLIISMQTWMNRRNDLTANFNCNLGDIVYTDLGITYKLELSYAHPVVIIENIGNMVLVVPVTTSQEKVNEAYHPIDNIDGNKYIRKVNKDEDNFEETCAVLISNIRTISPGRLIRRKDKLRQNISDPNSLFVEIKNKIFEYYLPKYYYFFKKISSELENKNQEIEDLNTKIIEMMKKIDDLEQILSKKTS